MADRDRAAVDVDLGHVPAHFLVHRAGLCGEGLVDLEQVQVGRAPACAGQRLARGRHRAHAHDRGVETGAGIGRNARQRFEAQRSGLGRTHHHHAGGTVVQARGIARRHRAGLVEGWPQAGQRFGVGLLVDELIGGEQDRIALALRDADRDDLVLEAAGVLCGTGFLLAAQRQRILLLAGDAVLLGHVLGGDAHVVLVVDVPQAVDDHRVNELPVAHALAVAGVRQHVGRQAHVLLAAGDDDVAVTVADGLSGQHHRLQARAADLVDRESRHSLRQAALDHRLARGVLARAGSQHLTQDHFADLLASQTAALEQGFDDGGAQLRCRRAGESAAEFTHRGACGGDDDDVHAHVMKSP